MRLRLSLVQTIEVKSLRFDFVRVNKFSERYGSQCFYGQAGVWWPVDFPLVHENYELK